MDRIENCRQKKKVPSWRPPQMGVLFSMILLTLTSISVQAEDPPFEGKNEPAEKNDIPALVAQLGADSYPIRVKAMQELWELGIVALPSLRAVLDDKDPEVTKRASELVLYISAGVLPNSPEEVKELVLRFSRSALNDQLVILRKLIDISQWQQVLHLARLEKSPAAQAKMATLVKEAASRAVRDAIMLDNFDLASEILELTGDDERNMLMRAWFYVRQGKFKEQLEKSKAMPEKKGSAWRMSLHRANGDVKAAIAEAKKSGFNDLAAGMVVFTGDSLPLLRALAKNGDVSSILGMGFQMQQLKLLGEDRKADAIAFELSGMNHDEDSFSRVATCLAANGYRDQAVDLMIRHDQNSAVDYFDRIEMPQRSLELLGIPKTAKLPYPTWVKDVTAVALEDKEAQDRLLMLAGFLDGRGHGEHALSVMRPIMKALEKGDPDAWFDLLAKLRSQDLGWLAITFARERGNEDMMMDLSVKKILGARDDVTMIWGVLKKRNPDDINQALHELALLAGIIPDTNQETDQIHQTLLDAVIGENPDPDLIKDKYIEALFNFAFKRNNAVEASRLLDIIAARNNRWRAYQMYLDYLLHRWEKVEPAYAAIVEERPGDYLTLMKWCMSLRKLGRVDEAAEAYDRALMLSMGDASALHRIGLELANAGYDDEAAAICEHAAIMAASGSAEYDSAILYLALSGEHLYTSKQWQKAAAIHEVCASILMRGRSRSSYLSSILRVRFYANFYHAMYLLENGGREQAIIKLDKARQLIPGDGSLADHFFPALRKAGLGAYYDRWFEDSYRHIASVCEAYPRAHNSQNTAAWLASRAVRRLDDAHQHAEAALQERPLQGAYLDTMGEVWFARGNRAKAVEWGERAVAASIGNAQGIPRGESQVLDNFNQLMKQLRRFKEGALPK